jgi:hypothetical protein
VSEVIGHPLTNFSEGVATLANITYMPEGYQYSLIPGQGYWLPSRAVVRGYWIPGLYRHLQEGCPSNQEKGNLFAIPLKKIKVKIKIEEVTVYFNTNRRFIFKLISVLFHHF